MTKVEKTMNSLSSLVSTLYLGFFLSQTASAALHDSATLPSHIYNNSVSSATTRSHGEYLRSTRLDLLRKKSLPAVEGISRMQPRGWQLHGNFSGFKVSRSKSEDLLSKLYGDFSLRLSCHLLNSSRGSVLTVRHPRKKLPYLDIQFNLVRNVLTFRYLGIKSFQRVKVPGAFPSLPWSRVQVDLLGKTLVLHVDCLKATEVTLRQGLAGIPTDACIYFGNGRQQKPGLQGIIFEAMLSVHAETSVEDCPFTAADHLAADQPIIPGHTVSFNASISNRVTLLEEQMAELIMMVDMMKAQNLELTSRVKFLETCECRPSCVFNGTTFREGMMWSPDTCTVCQCLDGLPSCKKRLDVSSCVLPCMSSPCQHSGICQDMLISTGVNVNIIDGSTYHCHCPPPFTGANCEVRQNPCVWPIAPGNCELQLERFFYDRVRQQCLPFNFTGCDGNLNNYENIEQCVNVAMVGACCYRTFKTTKDSIISNTQNVQVNCRVTHAGECQTLHRPQGGLAAIENGITATEDTEVISFYPGLSCEETGCINVDRNCTVGQQVFQPGKSFQLGCQDCTCQEGGILNCTCRKVDKRRELRDMTRKEVVQFQQAVAQLRLGSEERVWEQFRDLYMTHRMHASGSPYFLPWNRYFLRQMEQKLQEIDCDIVMPYFDFTTDVGNFSQAIIWQANYFGGDGNKSNSGCVPDHPFGDPKAWEPCISRQFNISVNLPTQVEIALALASDDFMDMSMCLETAVAYVHAFVGGDMMTSGGPYDPVFYAVHAYVDMLYWDWQQTAQNKFQFPAAYGQIPMIPFNIPPWHVFDSFVALCVTYAYPSQGNPCNITELQLISRPEVLISGTPVVSLHNLDPGRQRSDIPVASEDRLHSLEVVENTETVKLDLFGYNVDGFDRSGFDRYSFDRKGYNQDGFNRKGFDLTGFDRYGFDVEGYSYDGFNKSGLDRAGERDTSGRFGADGYDAFCFDRNGLNRQGFDQFWYSVNGYDHENCNFHFHGPFAPRQSLQIFAILRKQSKPFLMSLARTCPRLHAVPELWLKQSWITERKVIAGMVEVNLPTSFPSIPTQRFCFDTDMFLTACVCDHEIATCEENPCSGASCLSFPEAKCHINFCGQCQARWILDGKEVNCSAPRDHCQPNPCEHGGSCIPSEWPNESHLTTCICPPGFEGHLCQYQVQDMCSLPLSTGKCEQQETRWYYSLQSGNCEKFLYTGCHGNANNFVSSEACETRCVLGACCFREPMVTSHPVGYDNQGYNRYGFNLEGFNRLNKPVTVNLGIASGQGRFDEQGLDWQGVHVCESVDGVFTIKMVGFSMEGYNQEGFNRYGYDREGFDLDGYNLTGFSRIGDYDGIIDYDKDGYDADGFNRAGFNCQGHDRQGYNVYGVLQGFTYKCRAVTRSRCQLLEQQRNVEVVRFELGKQCSEVQCGESCGCLHGNRTYQVGKEFRSGCQSCMCMEGGHTVCVCDYATKRREVRELSQKEMQQYQTAVRQLNTQTGYPSRWFQLASVYAIHKPQAVGTPAFIPWHRKFLFDVEQELQAVDCSIAIPYYDWTLDAGDPTRAIIWAANMFGGNGQVDGCVRYHPFKNYYPPLLAPCLRRRFNDSVHLPDAVNVQLALNEQDYNRFRLHMEMFAKLFQSFVGGHMATDLAPYDPVFYSVVAYIDKLWADWQGKYDDGLLRYPAERRFLPMAPFGSTPDDVMDSRIQLCVEYLPLLGGVPCNISVVRNFGYDAQGFDRHGYDRNGFDQDGYTIDGVDKDGIVDNRGLYNTHGFSREGYSRSGFDQTGFDKYGFYLDAYNLDGFDPWGYDRSGYDRYGFNQQGYNPVGFHRNGSLRSGVVSTNVEIYEPYGFNIYGYSKFGFDREGYDVFGFNSNGFNRQVCSYYHLGPAYILVKKIVEEKLKDLSENQMKLIGRICPDVSPLPEYQLRNNWFYRNDQNDLVEIIHTYHLQHHMMNPMLSPRNTSILPSRIWLPVPPDARFCMLTYAYSPCKLSMPPVTCLEDLCIGHVCPDHPTAVCHTSTCGQCQRRWYDGVTGHTLNCTGCIDSAGSNRQEGETWSSSQCSSCTCQEGMVVCRQIQCDAPACDYPVKLSDQCCPSCQGCDYSGQIVPSGQPVRVAEKPCATCLCQQGNLECMTVVCPDLGKCRSPTTLDGDCCPVCLDCGQYTDGDVWSPSPCQRCSCQRGEIHCDKIQCPPTDCQHPYTPQGHCCPVCQECFYQGNLYQSGSQFQPDPCSSCTCERGTVQCRKQECPPVNCAKPVTLPQTCCPACDLECDYEGVTYSHSQDFTPSYNPCLNCTCDNSMVRCRPVHCPPVKFTCSQPMAPPGECCPTMCPRCSYEGQEYDEGQSWPASNNKCQLCECQGGVVRCYQQRTCTEQCTHGVPSFDDCCSPCTDCLYEGRIIMEGRKITIPGDPCQECLCRRGNLQCEGQPPCQRLPCTLTSLKPGYCCHVCVGCNYQGRDYNFGDVISQTDCSRCLCQEGQIMCTDLQDRCSVPRCKNPQKVPGQCCLVCEGCDYYSQYYEDGQEFISPRDPCQRCTCQKGQVTCKTLDTDCPSVPCTHPARVRDQCCPRCNDCFYQRRLLRNGQQFSPPEGDPCSICKCQDGSVTCERTECPVVTCASPSIPPGQCCPVCPAVCRMEGREFRNGETFRRPGDDCSTCTCQDGQVRCELMACPATSCIHPATLPGECCPRCDFCLYERRIFRSMQRFLHPDDPCQQCSCQQGSVMCDRITCPVITCARPVPMAGQCCPACPKLCEYKGLTYDDGETFSPPNSPCEECLCRQGQVQCKQVSCPQPLCRYPRREGCCPVCNGCNYGGLSIPYGEIFPDPRDPCYTCHCQSGEVTCQPKSCPQVSCRNPVKPACCAECSDCDYQGKVVMNGTVFTDPRDECHECLCMAGSVDCQRKSCNPAACQHPVQLGCCPDCSACMYQGRQYSHGQAFSDPDNPCKECTCNGGTVTCQQWDCPPVTCSSPSQGSCCPQCQDCQYLGRTIRNGQKVLHSSDPCQECQCRNGDVTCFQKECPRVSCRYPVQRGCCSDCTDCSYQGREYRSGAQFPDVRDKCSTCRCAYGNVACQQTVCPSVSCSHPAQGQCCRECSRCVHNNQQYEDGQEFRHPTDACQTCQCNRGNVRCLPEDCSQRTPCSHPVTIPGSCCPVCSEGCFYQGRLYQEGEGYREGCRECLCSQGTLHCYVLPCPPVNCTHPVNDGCCPVCGEGCYYQGRLYQEGEGYKEGCQECLCSQGTLHCHRLSCPPVSCMHPVNSTCCPACSEGCYYQGRLYQEGEGYKNGCQECLCSQGTLSCQMQSCPPIRCMHPVNGTCCPECDEGCYYQGRLYQEGEGYREGCQECLCSHGTLSCRMLSCPPVNCLHPVNSSCCPVCEEGCHYQGRLYQEGEGYLEGCQECICSQGTHSCRPRSCTPVSCRHPVIDGCCPICDEGCFYQGRLYQEGEGYKQGCQECLCTQGTLGCRPLSCPPVSCLHPVNISCCPVCEQGCYYQGQLYQEGEGYKDGCQECICSQGTHGCYLLPCPPVSCTHPVNDGCCPACTDCEFEGRRFYNGQVLRDRNDICGECSCKNGTFSCERAACPAVTCLNPALGKCCPECNNCQIGDRRYRNGQHFSDPDNHCQQCVCEFGTVSCERAQCDQARCKNPILDECGCGSCRGCQFSGQVYTSGQVFDHPSDPCQQCLCQTGTVSCDQRHCESICTHPAKTSGCCPLCTDCMYEGVVRQQGLTFISEVDACQECACQAGNIKCNRVICPQVTCLNSIRAERQCCPTCPVCKFLGQTYQADSRFTHPEDDCQTCTCKEGRVVCEKQECIVECTHPRLDVCCPQCDLCSYEGRLYNSGQSFQPDNCKRCLCLNGNVVCEEEKCPELNCLLTEQLPEQCCPQCKGCEYHENYYASNTSFLLPTNPCISCTCTGGLVICMERECYVPCDNPLPFPGQCCPLCPGCKFNGRSYSEGEFFSPNGDACDLCHCEDGHLNCLHETCPSVVNCPAESLLTPEPGQCCPVCAGLSSGCSVADLGKITRPRLDDPCFYCECKDDFSWVCVKEHCDMIQCPPDVQLTLPGQCCPSCPACFDRAEAAYHHEGETWSTLENPCILCLCQDGRITCAIQECLPLSCGPMEQLVHKDSDCCEKCEAVAEAQCIYQGKTIQPGEEWIVDECTRCQCQGGRVSCSIQNCPVEDCGKDEVRATSPGRCCPICLTRPGSCMVFGDPHYRTFDGATLHFQGTCRYVMAADCESKKFNVEVQHDSRNAPGEVSWAQNLTITIGDIVVELLQNSIVRVNGVQVSLPFLSQPHVYVELTGTTVLLTTNIGLQVSWNGDSQAEVLVPGSFKRQLCGLCGNFNGFPHDDLRTSLGQITNSPAVFGNSWKSETQLSESCQDAKDVDPCLSAGYRVRKIATTRCAVIKGEEFVRCHRVVSPEPFFSSCVYDMCVCLDEPKCLCDILSSYAHECNKAGVKLEWRSKTLCAIECPEDKGFMFDECGPVCPRTCENRHSPLGNLTSNCFKPCVPSCQCTADKVVYDGRCISPSECPYIHSHTLQ